MSNIRDEYREVLLKRKPVSIHEARKQGLTVEELSDKNMNETLDQLLAINKRRMKKLGGSIVPIPPSDIYKGSPEKTAIAQSNAQRGSYFGFDYAISEAEKELT